MAAERSAATSAPSCPIQNPLHPPKGRRGKIVTFALDACREGRLLILHAGDRGTGARRFPFSSPRTVIRVHFLG